MQGYSKYIQYFRKQYVNPRKKLKKKDQKVSTNLQPNILVDEKEYSSDSNEWIQNLIDLPASPVKQEKSSSIHDISVVIKKQKFLIEKLQRQLQKKKIENSL